jgi:hypothetical protein
MSPDGPEERTEFYDSAYERDIDAADVADMLADESRHAIDWVTDEKLITLARQRLAMLDPVTEVARNALEKDGI